MAGGYTLHTCSCGDSYKDGQTAALGHSYGAWTVVKEATTTSEGSQTRTCSRCGAKETQSIPKKPGSKYDVPVTTSNIGLLEERVLYYINEYRIAQGSPVAISLPNLKAYAKYRSKQIVINFNHDPLDIRNAATALKYGEYIDVEEPYYNPPCKEAIGMVNMNPGLTTVDQQAKELAEGCRESPSHWSYVGSAQNIYISVGITNNFATSYITIAVTNTNIYG